MSLILSDTKYYTEIANALREVSGTSEKLKPNQFGAKIRSITKDLTPFGVIHVDYPEGSICTCIGDNGVNLTAGNTSGRWNFLVSKAGTYTVRATDGSNQNNSSIVINEAQGGGAFWLSYRSIPSFTYTGNWEALKDDGTKITEGQISTYRGNWNIRFLTSGTLTINETFVPGNYDVFLVGGGGGSSDGNSRWAGGGGKRLTSRGIDIVLNNTYSLTIGAGGAGNTNGGATGGTTSGFNLSVAGGIGGWQVINGSKYCGNDSGGYAFDESSGSIKYGSSRTSSGSGAANTGTGGSNTAGEGTSYNGGSGVIIIRNARPIA